jgi:hypothetical protein
MDENERDLTKHATAAIAIAVVSVMVVSRVNASAERRRKLKKIQDWKSENLACVEVVRQRLMNLAHTPATTSAIYMAAMRDEKEFLTIMFNRPMY